MSSQGIALMCFIRFEMTVSILVVDILTGAIVYECVVYLTTAVLKLNSTHVISNDLGTECIVLSKICMLCLRQVSARNLI